MLSPDLQSPRNGPLIEMRDSGHKRKPTKQKDVLKTCVSKIKDYTRIRSIHDINQKQLIAINDLGSRYLQEFTQLPVSFLEKEYHAHQQSQIKTLIFNILERLRRKKVNTISPGHPLIIFWNCFKFLQIFHLLFVFPLFDAFGTTVNEFIDQQQQVFYIELAMLLCDLGLNLNLQVYHNGVLLIKTKDVAYHYLKYGFIIDFCGFIGCFIFIFLRDSWFKYIFFFKIPQLRRFTTYIQQHADPQQRFRNHVKLIRLLVIVVSLAHFIACLWAGIGMNYPNNWIQYRGIQDVSWQQIYLTSLYFAITTMTTVGYGDITAHNIQEVSCCIGIILCSSGVFGYVLNTIQQILKDIEQSHSRNTQELQAIQTYLTKKGLSKDLKFKVEQYLRESWKHGVSELELEAFDKLCKPLKDEIQQNDKGTMLLKIPFFVHNFSLNFFKVLTLQIKELNFLPQEIITIQDGVFMVFKGVLDLRAGKNQICSLMKGDFAGVASLFKQQIPLTRISDNFSMIYYLSKADILKYMPKLDFERFHEIKDRVLQNLLTVEMQCALCRKNHEVCNDIMFSLNRQQVLDKYLKSVNQERYQCRRSRNKLRTQLSTLQERTRTYQYQSLSPIKQNAVMSSGDSMPSDPLRSENSEDDDERAFDEDKRSINVEMKVQKSQRYLRTVTNFLAIKEIIKENYVEEDFDTVAIYTNYFPEANIDNVMRKVNMRKRRRQKKFIFTQ